MGKKVVVMRRPGDIDRVGIMGGGKLWNRPGVEHRAGEGKK